MQMTSNGQSNGSSQTPQESTNVYLDAWEQILSEALAAQQRQWTHEWTRDLARIEAQSQAVVAELRATIVERLNGIEQRVAERLALVRDGAPGADGKDGKDGEAGP